MAKYLSIDLESTGLEEDSLLLQLALVPVDTSPPKVFTELAGQFIVQCPSFEELKPNLNSWVKKHNKEMIEHAHKEGISPELIKSKVVEYLASPPIKAFFGDERIVLLGKSLSALDIPMLNKYLGLDFMRNQFHHHTADVTCLARGLVDAGLLPPGHASGSKLVKFFQINDEVKHTAIEDAIDMANIYLKILEFLKPKPAVV